MDVAKARIESLNHSVTVETISDWSALLPESIESTLQAVDVVCVTDWKRDDLVCYGCIIRVTSSNHSIPSYRLRSD